MCYDVLAVFAASIVALLIRFDLNIKSVPFQYMDEVWRALPFMIIVTLIIFWMLRLYSSLWSYAGALEAEDVAAADDDADLDARSGGRLDLFGVGLEHFGRESVFLRTLQRFAAQFEEYSLVFHVAMDLP